AELGEGGRHVGERPSAWSGRRAAVRRIGHRVLPPGTRHPSPQDTFPAITAPSHTTGPEGRAAGETRPPGPYGEARAQPQARSAVETTSSSLRRWSSTVSRLPSAVDAKPHCGLIARYSGSTYRDASSIRRSRSSWDSST